LAALTVDVDQLEQLLASGNDSAALRVALGTAYLKADNPIDAIEHLQAAIALDGDYSAAWKLLGQAQATAARNDDAEHSYTRGIEVATRRGDMQAAREMQVYLKRLEKRRESS
jgi:Tfp pilus assembly protein PilF